MTAKRPSERHQLYPETAHTVEGIKHGTNTSFVPSLIMHNYTRSVRRKEFLRHFRIYFIVSASCLAVLTFSMLHIVDLSQAQMPNSDIIMSFGRFRFGAIVVLFASLLISAISSIVDAYILRQRIYRVSLGKFLLIVFAVQSTVLLIVIGGLSGFIHRFVNLISSGNAQEVTFSESLPWIVPFAFILFLGRLFIEIDRKLGPGNLWKMISGKLYRPREEARIFMFIDLKDSTAIAERLGHLKFSRLIKDCFQDLSVVDAYHAEIYQYVGDEVVMSWSPKMGLTDNRFLKAFFAFEAALEKRRSHYEDQYGLMPYFKTGINCGMVVATEVGDVKREISYHGDTLNTAARIQEMCNFHQAQVLMTQEMYSMMTDKHDFVFENVGDTSLKGKEKTIQLYKVGRN